MLRSTELRLFFLCSLLFQFQIFGVATDEFGSTTPGSTLKKSYLKSNFALSWFDAWQYCREKGLFLASVESSVEQLNLESVLAPIHGRQWWTSGTDLGIKGQWRWMSSGNPLSYTNWGLAEPNNSPIGKNCLKVWDDPNGGVCTWANEYCINKYFFICEQIE